MTALGIYWKLFKNALQNLQELSEGYTLSLVTQY